MSIFGSSRWIWLDADSIDDEYGEFKITLPATDREVKCRLSCDGDYTLFVDGRYAASNQYGDFEHYKIYDEIDLGRLSRETELCFLVWHHGRDTQRYRRARAGLVFEIVCGGEIIAVSNSDVLCRRSPYYMSGREKTVTGQLGFGFLYDATADETAFHPAVCVEKNCTFYPRPIAKMELRESPRARIIAQESTRILLDLGREVVGLPTLRLISECEQRITVAFGEHLVNGSVPRIISHRDFSFEYIARVGEQEYTNYMLRLGCRYLEIFSEEPVTLLGASVIPQIYPVSERRVRIADTLDHRIYDLCLSSLRLCMMEHYVDCPWREQCLYVFDSRNQMLCGYLAFEDGNREYARSNHKLISMDTREDGQLSICYPCGVDLTIPSFSLYWFMSVREYTEHTGDLTLAREVYPKLLSVLGEFVANRRDGLVCKFGGTNNWNFYDWSEGLEGDLRHEEAQNPDLMINCLFISALENLRAICEAIGEVFEYGEMLEECRARTVECFFDSESGLFMLDGDKLFHSLPNALAILLGLAKGDAAARICERIVAGETLECSLSMKVFVYDALLAVDPDRYRGFVLDEIRRIYKKMLDSGASATWETAGGAEDFKGAGSLCHGWSAIPIYFYHKLGIAEYADGAELET